MLKLVSREVHDLDDPPRFSISLMLGLKRSTTMICLKPAKTRGATSAALKLGGVR